MADATETLERKPDAKTAEPEKESEVKQKPDETFDVDGEYIAEQAREAMRIFFLPVTSLVRAAKAKSRAVRRDVRRERRRAA